MSRKRSHTVTVLALVGSLCAAACTSPSQPERVPSVDLTARHVSLGVGDTLRLSLLPMLPPGYVPSVRWSSSAPLIADIKSTGSFEATIQGVSPGQAVITAAGDGVTDSALVTVAAPEG